MNSYAKPNKMNTTIFFMFGVISCIDIYLVTMGLPDLVHKAGYIVIILLSLIILFRKRVHFNFLKLGWVILFILFAFSAFINMGLGSFNRIFSFQFLAILVGSLCLDTEEKGFRIFFRIILINGFIHCFGVISELLIPSIWKIIFSIMNRKLLSDVTVYYNFTYGYLANGYVTGFAYNPGYTATFIVNGIIALGYFKSSMKRGIYNILFIGMMVCLFITGKRGHVVVLSISILAAYLLSAKSFTENTKKVFIATIALLILYLIGYHIYNSNIELSSLRRILQFIYNGDLSSDTGSGRTDLWGLAVPIIQNNLLVGIGWGEFARLYINEVHNTYLQVAAEVGIFAGLLFALLVVEHIHETKKIYTRLQSNHQSSQYDCIFSMVFTCQIFFLIDSFIANTLWNVEIFYFFIICSLQGLSIWLNTMERT